MNKFALDVKGNGASKMLVIRAQFITQTCADTKELDWVINYLQKDLERLRKQGHRMFSPSMKRAPIGKIPAVAKP